MKVVITAFAIAGLGLMACGSGGFDVEECKSSQEAFNKAAEECIEGWTAADWGCEAIGEASEAAGTTCDYADFYAYYKSVKCEEGKLTYEGETAPTPKCE